MFANKAWVVAAVAASTMVHGAVFAQGLQQAPTIQTLSNIKVAEREKETQDRLQKLAPPAPAPAASKAASEKLELLVRPAPTPKIRRVLSIYGRAGQEQADVARADGVVETVRAGAVFDGFRVLSIGPDGVQFERLAAKRGGKGGARQDAKGAGASKTFRVATGGMFE